MTSTSLGTEGELSLTITPHGHIEWRGPRAKLQAIGVVPPAIKWPRSVYYTFWEADGASFTLHRCRPDSLIGRKRGWTKCDHWCVQRFVSRAGQGSILYWAQRELGALLSQAIGCGEAIWINIFRLDCNERIVRLDARLVPGGGLGSR